MPKIPRRKKRFIIMVISLSVVCLSYLVIGILPHFQGSEISVDHTTRFKHPQERAYYRFQVSKGKKYSFMLEYYDEELQPEIRLFSHSFKTFGRKTVESYPVNGLAIDFTAKHDGSYYVTVLNSEGGYYFVTLSSIPDVEYFTSIKKCANPWNFMLFLIFVSLVPITMGFAIDFYRHKTKEEKTRWQMRNIIKCPGCGIHLKKDSEYCNTCGYTFSPPKDYENYQV
jgi:hypothetical protein